jgi:DNA-binding LacI/PurR family transcriptional regulator
MSFQDNHPVSEPTIRDVALRAGVSVGTVSRVMNRAPGVRKPMREAVERAVRELGYQPNQTARLLRANRSRAIGMVVSDLLHGMNVIAARGAEEAAEARGYSLLLADARHNPEVERRLIDSLLSRRVEGLLIQPVRSIQVVEETASRANVPLLIFGQLRLREGTHTAIIEEHAASRAAVRSLLDCGHRRFLLTGQDQRVTANRLRDLRSLINEMADREVTVESLVVPGSFEGAESVRNAMVRPDRSTAVISLTLSALPYTLRALRDAGLAIPSQVSVLSFGDSEWAEAHTPPIDVIEGSDELPPSPVAQSRYINRGSVGPAPKTS